MEQRFVQQLVCTNMDHFVEPRNVILGLEAEMVPDSLDGVAESTIQDRRCKKYWGVTYVVAVTKILEVNRL